MIGLPALALRLAAIEVLAPHGTPANGPWPTLAGGAVYDSAIGPVDGTDAAERLVTIGVYSEGAGAEPMGSGRDIVTVAVEAMVDLTFDVSIAVRDQAGALAYAATDAAAEASLDWIEAQIVAALIARSTAGALPLILKRIASARSQRFADPDTGARLAARLLTLTCAVVAGDLKVAAGASDLDRLPLPLRAVALALPAGSYGRVICEQVANGGLIQPPRTPFEEARLGALLQGSSGSPADPDIAGQATF
jgi:hypothetical protein